jgi:hypothetical protein
LWITWYDLPADGRDAHLAWLHGIYLPKVLKRPGVLHGAHYAVEKLPPTSRRRYTNDTSVPTGSDYILLFGAETPDVFSAGADAFVKGAPDRFDAELTDEDRKMLAMKIGERVALVTEAARVDGPEAGQREPGMLLSPCIQVGSYNTGSTEVETELLSWYADWRMPALSKMPGCVGVRRYVSAVGWAKHGVLYEFVSREARSKYWPTLASSYPEMEAWSNRFIPNLTHAPGSANPAHRIWPPVK